MIGPTLEAVASTTDGFNSATANRGRFAHLLGCLQLLIFKLGTYIRGLHEAWSRMDKGSDLAKFIESYVMVQVSNTLLAILEVSPDPHVSV